MFDRQVDCLSGFRRRTAEAAGSPRLCGGTQTWKAVALHPFVRRPPRAPLTAVCGPATSGGRVGLFAPIRSCTEDVVSPDSIGAHIISGPNLFLRLLLKNATHPETAHLSREPRLDRPVQSAAFLLHLFLQPFWSYPKKAPEAVVFASGGYSVLLYFTLSTPLDAPLRTCRP